jgi:16S rRNA (cytosine1402-N4)-methyltransferase
MSTPSETPFTHRPVMVAEVVDLFLPVPAGLFVDATVGGGGHAAAVLDRRDDLELLGIDRDDEALEAASRTLRPFGDRVTLARHRFDELGDILSRTGRSDVSGVFFDLGVSSRQFDAATRGFSYRHDGPLDMRMDRRQGRSAADVVNDYDQSSLAGVLSRYGDERYASRIAAAIVSARPISSTNQLADVVKAALPAPARRRRGHPAKRSFQAIRIEVNGELDILPAALDSAVDALRPRGRCAVLSYHSGEDRIVKERFRHAVTGGCTCPPRLPCQCGAVRKARHLGRSGRRPTQAEVEGNPRASSARLRAVERIVASAADDTERETR